MPPFSSSVGECKIMNHSMDNPNLESDLSQLEMDVQQETGVNRVGYQLVLELNDESGVER
jgi:hypothetical protein